MKVIDVDGESAVRIRAVADVAGVSYASLYHFFGDRQGLIDAAQSERYRRGLMAFLDTLGGEIRASRTKDEFRATITRAAGLMWSSEWAEHRWSRISSLASMPTRPHLAVSILDHQREYNVTIAAMLRDPQQRGWIRPDVDLEMLAAWALGVTNGRILVEMDPERADPEAWNRIALNALQAAMFAD